MTYAESVEFIKEEGREEGREEGKEEGREEKLIDMIRIKVDRGKILSRIADELEENAEDIRPIYEAILRLGTKQDTQTIYQALHS